MESTSKITSGNKLLQNSTNEALLKGVQTVSHKYQTFIQDAEEYYIRAFELSPETAKEYRGRGKPPKYRIMNLHPPLPPEQIHASPEAANHYAVRNRTRKNSLAILQSRSVIKMTNKDARF